MFIKSHKFNLNDAADLTIDIHHNRAHISLMLWDSEKEDWFTVDKTVHGWEDFSELVSIAMDLAENYVANARKLFYKENQNV